MRGQTRSLFVVALCLLHAAAGAQTTPAPQAAKPPPIAASAPRAASSATFSTEQLEQLAAPIALYPDSLLSQVLMAATYPADVAEAAKWSKANKDMKGDAAVQAVQDKPWDPSVQALAAFPQVLQAMGDQPDWVQNLGDAFLASSKDMLDAVQRLRTRAQQAGNLKSNEQQKVIVEEAAPAQTVIKIEPAQPDTIYVPAYNPTYVYGTWPYPYYPPYYWPPYSYYYPGYYPGAAFAAGVFWGVAIGSIMWGNCNWGGGNININVDRFNQVNHNRQIDRGQNTFQHNAANRKGVPYRDQASRDRYGQGRGGAEARNNYRGRDPVTESRRQQAQSQLQSRGMDPAQARDALRNDPATRQRAQQAAQGAGRDLGAGGRDFGGGRQGGAGGAGGRDFGGGTGNIGGGASNIGASRDRAQALGGNDHAFRGANNPGQSRQSFDRGSASRASASNFGGGGGRAGGGGARGGGGGRGGGRR
ncbi:MAG TPA: DUF3300 domain-containing protein [Burkholderiaceae bacterium]|nr:DUF3300 domain-containing protein [Burkholderiaceae bacterium]